MRDTAMEAVKAARAAASKYPLMAAMKQAEAWRTGDDSWARMAPPLVALSDEQKINWRADLTAHKGGLA
jgi:4-hydroxy-tetrahydrodipicolinate synthase